MNPSRWGCTSTTSPRSGSTRFTVTASKIVPMGYAKWMAASPVESFSFRLIMWSKSDTENFGGELPAISYSIRAFTFCPILNGLAGLVGTLNSSAVASKKPSICKLIPLGEIAVINAWPSIPGNTEVTLLTSVIYELKHGEEPRIMINKTDWRWLYASRIDRNCAYSLVARHLHDRYIKQLAYMKLGTVRTTFFGIFKG